MTDFLAQPNLFPGLDSKGVERLSGIARKRTLESGEYLFLLGDNAEDFYVVVLGSVDLCFPLSFHGAVKDITVETATAGQILGWSALVKPYRFTLSARATAASEVLAFSRRELLPLFEAEPTVGCAFLTKVSEVVGVRLLTFQALWARGLQQLLEAETQARPG